jgi:hypothetical protein
MTTRRSPNDIAFNTSFDEGMYNEVFGQKNRYPSPTKSSSSNNSPKSTGSYGYSNGYGYGYGGYNSPSSAPISYKTLQSVTQNFMVQKTTNRFDTGF